MELLFETLNLIKWGGILLVILLVFAETGLLLGLMIPGGETLIFTAGFLTSTGVLQINIFLFLTLLIIAGFLGDCSGFQIGKKLGSSLYKKKDTWYFKQSYLQMAKNYFQKHKRQSLILGKFLPIIRPFSPLVAGITEVKPIVFYGFSLMAIILYMSLFLLGGYYLGNAFPEVKNYLGWILPASVLLLLFPVIIQLIKHQKQS